MSYAKAFLVLTVAMASSACATEDSPWVIANDINKLQSKETTFAEHWKVSADGALTAMLKDGGQTLRYVRRTDWPEQADFELTLKYSFHVPQGVKCKETPLFNIAFRLGGDRFLVFYRGFQFCAFELWSGNSGHLIANNHILQPAPDTEYSLRLVAQGGVMKAKVWPAADPEPARWALEAEIKDALPGGSLALGFKDWKEQAGVELTFRDVAIKPYVGKPLVFLDEPTRPVYLTDSQEGRAFVGHRWMEYGIPDCKWPAFKSSRTIEWNAGSVTIPTGVSVPEFKDGQAVIAIPETAAAAEAGVVWMKEEFARGTPLQVTVQGSKGTRPLIFFRTRSPKSPAWGAPVLFDPVLYNGLAGIRDTSTGLICEYGTAHLLKDGLQIRTWIRFYNGVSLIYGPPEEPCERLETGSYKVGGLPKMSFNSVCQIGFSGAGKAGTVTMSPIELEK